MTGYSTCSAVTKFGSTAAVCDLVHGHPGNHKAFVPPGRYVEWPQESW